MCYLNACLPSTAAEEQARMSSLPADSRAGSLAPIRDASITPNGSPSPPPNTAVQPNVMPEVAEPTAAAPSVPTVNESSPAPADVTWKEVAVGDCYPGIPKAHLDGRPIDEYERMRLFNVQRNQHLLEELKLSQGGKALLGVASTQKKATQRHKAAERTDEVQEPRQSSRVHK